MAKNQKSDPPPLEAIPFCHTTISISISITATLPPAMAAFSTTDAAIITHQVELDQNAQAATAAASGQSIDHLYDVPLTATKIVAGRFRHVALQFPDEALVDSVPIFWSLKRHIRSLLQQQQQLQHESDGQSIPELYILADTSYGR